MREIECSNCRTALTCNEVSNAPFHQKIISCPLHDNKVRIYGYPKYLCSTCEGEGYYIENSGFQTEPLAINKRETPTCKGIRASTGNVCGKTISQKRVDEYDSLCSYCTRRKEEQALRELNSGLSKRTTNAYRRTRAMERAASRMNVLMEEWEREIEKQKMHFKSLQDSIQKEDGLKQSEDKMKIEYLCN